MTTLVCVKIELLSSLPYTCVHRGGSRDVAKGWGGGRDCVWVEGGGGGGGGAEAKTLTGFQHTAETTLDPPLRVGPTALYTN